MNEELIAFIFKVKVEVRQTNEVLIDVSGQLSQTNCRNIVIYSKTSVIACYVWRNFIYLVLKNQPVHHHWKVKRVFCQSTDFTTSNRVQYYLTSFDIDLLLISFIWKLKARVLESFFIFNGSIRYGKCLYGKSKEVITIFCWRKNNIRRLKGEDIVHEKRRKESLEHLLKLAFEEVPRFLASWNTRI